jgi:LemA protein
VPAGRATRLPPPSPDRYIPGQRGPRGYREAPMSTTAWVIIGIIVLLVLWIIMIYNGLVAMRQRVSQAFADIDVQLKQRHDLIPNLVETVKGYAAHERGTLEEVVKLRNVAMAAQGPAQQAAAENMLTGALRQMFALAESYPDLKANQNFQQLQRELSDIENKLAAARRFFNNAVQEYNTGIQQFPAALFAAALGFSPKEFFDVGEARPQLEQAPQVKF